MAHFLDKNILKTLKIRELFVFFVFYLLIFGPRILFADASLIVAMALGLPYFFIYHIRERKWNFRVYELVFLYLLAYQLILYASYDLSEVVDRGYYFFRLLRSFCLYYSFLLCFRFKLIRRWNAIKVFAVLFGMHLAVVLIQQFDIFGLKDIALKLAPMTIASGEDENEWAGRVNESNVRSLGLVSGYDAAGVIVGLFLLFALFSVRRTSIKVILALLAFLGVLVTSRTGILVYIVSLVFYFIVERRRVFALKFSTFIWAAVFLILIVVVFSLALNNVGNFEFLQRSFEIYLNYLDYGSLSTSSTDDLVENHWVLPRDWHVYLIGEPARSAAFAGGLDSDLGYIQILYNFGFVNLLVFLGLHLYALFYFARRVGTYFKVLAFYVLLLFVLNVKGPYFLSKGIYDVLIFVVASAMACSDVKRRMKTVMAP